MKRNKRRSRYQTATHGAVALSLAVAVSFVGGCASTSEEQTSAASVVAVQAGLSKEQVLQHEDVKGKSPTVFHQPVEKTREAALRALTYVGCEIKKQEPYYVCGRRPNKIGLFVGSGGETVEVFLYPQTDTETHVWVDTDLSFFGIAGQQGWNDQVLAEMKRLIGN